MLDSIIAGSILDPLYQLLSSLLTSFYGLVPNYTFAIGLLTFCIMVVVLPLTLKSTKSMLEMQVLQPQVKQLQQQFKGDRQAMNDALMKLYKEHKVNPLGGCVPMLLPLPVFIVMYRTIHGLVRVCTDGLAKVPAFAAKNVTSGSGEFCPQHVKAGTKLFDSLVGHTKMLSLGLDLSKPAATLIRDSFVKGLPYLGLVLVVAATSYYQQRQMTVRMKDQPANPQQQTLMRVMPAMFAVFSLFFPAALIVYFLVQNVFRIAQNGYITHRFYGEGSLAATARAATAAAKADSSTDKPEKAKPKPSTPNGSGSARNRPAPPSRPTRPTPASRAGDDRPSSKTPKPGNDRPSSKTPKPGNAKPASGKPPADDTKPARANGRPTPRPQPRPKPKDE